MNKHIHILSVFCLLAFILGTLTPLAAQSKANASRMYGEKPEPNAVGDIVFSDGSATALRNGLTLTNEQKNAVIAVGVYIGDGYIGEKDYLYVASVSRGKTNALIINDELGQIKEGDLAPTIPIDYNTLVPTKEIGGFHYRVYYPFVGMSTDGVKVWESIKKTIPWATGEKDRNGDYIKGFLPFIYADLYGSGKSFGYAIKTGSAYDNDSYAIAGKREFGSFMVTTPKLDGIYSSGWYIPSYAENVIAQESIRRFCKQLKNCTGLTIGDNYANRTFMPHLFTTGMHIQDSWEADTGAVNSDVQRVTGDVVIHKATKVKNTDKYLSPDEFGSDRCYIGDIVLSDGSLVHFDEYEPNPKNPVMGIIVFFKDKRVIVEETGVAYYEEFTGSKKNAVILSAKSISGTYYEAKEFAENFGIQSNLTGGYRNGWYLPSLEERNKIDTQIIPKCLSKIGCYTGTPTAIWTSEHEYASDERTLTKKSTVDIEDYWNSVYTDSVPGGAYTWGKREKQLARVLHDYVEPVRLVNYDNTPVTDRYNPYKVGDIVLQDGTIVSAENYRPNTRNPAVGVIAFFKDEKFPNSGDYGSRTGTKENAYIIGLKQKRGIIQWAASGAQGTSLIKELQTYPSVVGYGAANTATFYQGSDNDGSDNWSLLCAAVTDENRAGRYPVFEYAASYGKTAGITGTYSSGWYVPTIAELSYVYRNKRLINESIDLIDVTMRVSGALYFSSSQLSFDGRGTYCMNGDMGSIEYMDKTNRKYDGYGVLVIRPLSTAVKTSAAWSEPVVEQKKAENPLLKPSSGALIGEKAYPDAVGDIIFSDGSATPYSPGLYMTITEKQKKEAVAVAAFIGDGVTGKKGKIYAFSFAENTFSWFDYNSTSRFIKSGSWNGSGDFDGPYLDDSGQVDWDLYFAGNVDGTDKWQKICKVDPYGALNAEQVYPAWDFVNNLGEGWYVPSFAEKKKILENRELLNQIMATIAGHPIDRDISFTHGLYAFDMTKNIFGNGNVSSSASTTVSSSAEKVASDMVLVEGGSIRMGSNNVTLSSFYMCDHEVTQIEYESVMGNNPSAFNEEYWQFIADYKPVERISWYDAINYCNALSKKEGLIPCYTQDGGIYTCNFSANGYRLPTEAEWEFAARGGNKSKGYIYSGSDDLDKVAWYFKNQGDDKTHFVKTKLPNELGLYDMSGNVWEWCWDCWNGNSAAEGHVLRGGSYSSDAYECELTMRTNKDIGDHRDWYRFFSGFRVVRSASGNMYGSQGSSNKQDVKLADSDMVYVQGGTFSMGGEFELFDQYGNYLLPNSYQTEELRKSALPIHSVTVSDFYICDHEVTQLEYFDIVGRIPLPVYLEFRDDRKKDKSNYPAERMDWYDAIEYCNKRSFAEGLVPCYSLNGERDTNKWGKNWDENTRVYNWQDVKCDWNANGYRLLTEAEWEFAARGGNKSKGYLYSGSNDFDSVVSTGEYNDPIKSKLPNELGLYDMSGNDSEWVWDKYGDYSSQSQINPKGASSGNDRVGRGFRTTAGARVYYRDKGASGIRVGRTTLREMQPVRTVQSIEPVKITKTEPDKNGFILIEGGTFYMGCATGGSDEAPVHKVTLSSFYMCDHEVTQAEYKAVMGTNPSSFSGNNKPVEQVSWFDAIEYCNALSRKEGLTPCYTKSGNSYTCNWNANGYRLPTEAEWEYAARGGKESKSYTYSGGDAAGNVAWSKDNAGNGTHDVKTKTANELGLYDMSGNVSEWVWDWYGDYSSASQTDPRGVSTGSYRARRGGSWNDASLAATVTYRDGNTPSRTKNDRGFRVVRNAK